MNEHPLESTLSSIVAQAKSLPPETIATKAKEYAINAALAGGFALFKWGFKRGTFKPTKYTTPIYLATLSAVGYYVYKYREDAKILLSKAQEGLTSQTSEQV